MDCELFHRTDMMMKMMLSGWTVRFTPEEMRAHAPSSGRGDKKPNRKRASLWMKLNQFAHR